MAYKALYRKYRPEDFDNMVGQKHIVQTLKNAISNDKIAHAYIFSGPRGTGKTTTAKILAKALNCTGENKPCNECENCIAINEGRHPDIIEIDAASNNGVEEVRDLIEKVKFAPIQGKYKVYIIDEVHMMTPGAFNALLKTLEEPPEHVVFILATTDVHKVIPTILSRCQRFDFSKISFEDIKNRIEEILRLENIEFEDKVSSLIAELADGGMRDALSILDQVISYAGNKITLQHVYDVYGIMSSNDMINYLTLLSNLKTKDALDMIESFISKGIDIKHLTYDLMVCLKDAIVYNSTKDESVLERINKEQASKLLESYSLESALKVVDILNTANIEYKQTSNYRLYFELASLKVIDLFKTKEPVVEKVIEKVVEKVVEVKEEKKEEIKVTPVVEKAKPAYEAPEESEIISYTTEEYVNILCHGDKKIKTELSEKWSKIKDYLNDPSKRYVAQLLADSTIGAAGKDFILIIFKFKLIASRAKQKNNIILIRRFLDEIFNINLEVYTIDNDGFVDATRLFFDLRQANKLPNNKLPRLEIKEEKKEEKIEEKVSEEEKAGLDLFGSDLKIE